MYPSSNKERLSIVYLPVTSPLAANFFSFLQTHITLDVANVSMEGIVSVSFRESRYNLAKLMKQEGYDYKVYQIFVDKFEDELLKQHHKEQLKK